MNAIVNSVFNEKQRNEKIKTQNIQESKPLEQLIKEKIFQLFKNQQKINS